jgi:hypothetical protein
VEKNQTKLDRNHSQECEMGVSQISKIQFEKSTISFLSLSLFFFKEKGFSNLQSCAVVTLDLGYMPLKGKTNHRIIVLGIFFNKDTSTAARFTSCHRILD